MTLLESGDHDATARQPLPLLGWRMRFASSTVRLPRLFVLSTSHTRQLRCFLAQRSTDATVDEAFGRPLGDDEGPTRGRLRIPRHSNTYPIRHLMTLSILEPSSWQMRTV